MKDMLDSRSNAIDGGVRGVAGFLDGLTRTRLNRSGKTPLNDLKRKSRDRLESRADRLLLRGALLGLVLALVSPAAVAQLEARLGGQAVYDVDRGFTVTADANLPLTHRFGVSGINADGSMTWVTAQSWIDALNASNYLGFNDWRLPSGRSDGGNYCTQMPECSNGELYHLWLELGGSSVGAGDITGSTDPDLALFFNFPNEYYKFYWESTLNTRGRAWAYSFGQTSGTRHRVYDRAKADFIFVWPVRDGDVLLETAGDSGFHNPQDDSEYSWLAQSGVDGFQVSRSSEARFDFDCNSWQTPSLMIHDADMPAAGTVFFYLNRPQSPDPGSWGHGSSGGTRTGNCL